MKIAQVFNQEKIFFTSDHHFGHANVIAFDNRPFSTVYEMNYEMVRLWNETVPEDGVVFHLGDWAMNLRKHIGICKSLNGRIYTAIGNHDKQKELLKIGFEDVQDVYEIKVQEKNAHQRIFMSHYAHIVWNQSHRGCWHLHGHSHGTLPVSTHSYRMDVGVNINEYKPVTYQKVKEFMSKIDYRPIDGH